jgi:hypothetical protein
LGNYNARHSFHNIKPDISLLDQRIFVDFVPELWGQFEERKVHDVIVLVEEGRRQAGDKALMFAPTASRGAFFHFRLPFEYLQASVLFISSISTPP